jgi:predicted dehydrogenase
VTEAFPPIRMGILGTAAVARNRVVPGMRRTSSVEIVAIASRDADRARAAAREMQIPRAYDSYDALLDDPDIEAVYIPLPNHLHVPWSVRAAEQGKHVLCEKPIALSGAEARTLVSVRDRTRVQIAEAFMVRMHPQWLAARDLITSGRIGTLALLTAHFGYHRRDPNDVRSRIEWGGGILMDVGCYAVMVSRWLFASEPTDVIATLDLDPELGIDRLVSAILRFPNGQASFTCGGQIARYQRVNLFGDRGRIEIEIPLNAPSDRGCRLFVDDGRAHGDASAETIALSPVDQYAVQADHFARAVRGVAPFPMTLEDSVANMDVIDALFRSAETRRREVPRAD